MDALKWEKMTGIDSETFAKSLESIKQKQDKWITLPVLETVAAYTLNKVSGSVLLCKNTLTGETLRFAEFLSSAFFSLFEE